jgi:hypothetical protein
MSAPAHIVDPTLTATFVAGVVNHLDFTAAPRALPAGAIVSAIDVLTNPQAFTTTAPIAVGDTSVTVEARVIPNDISFGVYVEGFMLIDLSGYPGGVAFYYRGLIFGGIERIPAFPSPVPTFQVVSIQGFDQPAVTSGDLQRPLDSGQFIGVDVLGGRDVIVQVAIGANSPSALDAARAQVAAIMTPDPAGVTEYPLFFTTPGGTQYGVNARPRKYGFKIDVNSLLAYGVIATLQFSSVDPRIYSTPTQLLQLSASSGAVAGTAPNNGSMEMRPLFEIEAGSGDPAPLTVQQADLPGTPAIAFTAEMLAGDTILVDTDFHTAWYVPASGGPYDALSTLSDGSQWWNIPAGDVGPNNIHFTVTSGDGVLNLYYADAFGSV